MIAVGNGETCPFCKGKDKFVSQPDNNIIDHLISTHQDHNEYYDFLFGGKNIGM